MKERLGTVGEHSIFQMEGYFVWCGTMTKGDDGLYYLYFSFWPKGEDFYEGWVKYSKVGYAVSDNPYGGFVYRGIALEGTGEGWDASVIHNPGGNTICIIWETMATANIGATGTASASA